MFVIWPVFYMSFCALVQYVPSTIEKRYIMILANLLCFFGCLIQGPSKLLRFPDSLTMIIIGQVFLGIINAFLIIPSLPEMI